MGVRFGPCGGGYPQNPLFPKINRKRGVQKPRNSWNFHFLTTPQNCPKGTQNRWTLAILGLKRVFFTCFLKKHAKKRPFLLKNVKKRLFFNELQKLVKFTRFLLFLTAFWYRGSTRNYEKNTVLCGL